MYNFFVFYDFLVILLVAHLFFAIRYFSQKKKKKSQNIQEIKIKLFGGKLNRLSKQLSND